MTAEHAVPFVTGVAALLQLGAAFYSVRLISASGAAAGPAALGIALALMSCRRIASFSAAAVDAPVGSWGLPFEAIGLVASALMIVAVARLAEVFLARRRAEHELRLSHEGLRESADRERRLSQQCIQAQERERRLLSYEVHDGLAQYVFAAQMHLETYGTYVDRDTEKADYELGAVSARLASAVAEVRRLVSELRVSVLEDLGLAAAVQTHLRALGEHHDWEWELQNRLGDTRLHATLEIMVFRIVQEALTNAAKHAQAGRVEVTLGEDAGQLVAEVRDWGRGFDVQEALADAERLGLNAMDGRARLIQGECTIDSRPGRGTTVRLRAPLKNRDEEA